MPEHRPSRGVVVTVLALHPPDGVVVTVLAQKWSEWCSGQSAGSEVVRVV